MMGWVVPRGQNRQKRCGNVDNFDNFLFFCTIKSRKEKFRNCHILKTFEFEFRLLQNETVVSKPKKNYLEDNDANEFAFWKY